MLPANEIGGAQQIKAFAILPADHQIVAVEATREERHALVACGAALERAKLERLEIAGREDFRGDRLAAVGGIGTVIGKAAIILLEPYEA